MMDVVEGLIVISHAEAKNEIWRGVWAIHRKLSDSRRELLKLELIEEGQTAETFDDLWDACTAGRAEGMARAKAIQQ